MIGSSKMSLGWISAGSSLQRWRVDLDGMLEDLGGIEEKLPCEDQNDFETYSIWRLERSRFLGSYLLGAENRPFSPFWQICASRLSEVVKLHTQC
jgi:hypothetical protein